MATCAALGQAVGAAVCTAVQNGYISPRETAQKHIKEVQKLLLDDDCYLPGLKRKIPALSRDAVLTTGAGAPEVLRNGIDRELDGQDNYCPCQAGSFVQYDFGKAEEIRPVRIVFNSDLSRNHLNICANYFLSNGTYAPPETLVEDFVLEADGKIIAEIKGNFQRLVTLPVNCRVQSLKLIIRKIRGNSERCGIFAFDAQ